MKLLYAFTILWTLFTTAKGLDCQTCLNPQCLSETSVTCTTETMCVTATTQVSLGGVPNTVITKQCAPPSTCPSIGPQTVTINAGLSNVVTSAQCCNTDNCNTETLPAPTRNTTVNELECNFCIPNTDLCNIIVGCEGSENSCFQGTVTGSPIGDDILGCASTNLCDGAMSLGTQLFQTFGTITSGPTCCSTPFCNERSTGTMTTLSPTSVTGGSDGSTGSGSGGDGGSGGVTSGSGGDGGSGGVTSGSGGDGGSGGVTSGSGGDGGSGGVTSGSGGDGGSGGVTSGSGGDGGSGGVTSESGGDGGSGGVTSESGGDGGSGGVTMSSSPVLTCALTGPVGVVVMIFISTFG
ncbi:uncharacterized protein LOC114461622 [Gouania willdenowi]|uniref:uncharacterized protein LOC114461622 n=1 Tax=Gouania willdenowi TaxID=441366 RepID=UPI0010566C91|nr:uncharacterized protein LOC114461622 [Gouania willdenowi]